VRITLSAGVVSHQRGESVAALVERADLALYRAKSQGRNRVVVG
jgi:PleD family two-component response regulator